MCTYVSIYCVRVHTCVYLVYIYTYLVLGGGDWFPQMLPHCSSSLQPLQLPLASYISMKKKKKKIEEKSSYTIDSRWVSRYRDREITYKKPYAQTMIIDKDFSIEVLFFHPHGIHAMTPKMSDTFNLFLLLILVCSSPQIFGPNHLLPHFP